MTIAIPIGQEMITPMSVSLSDTTVSAIFDNSARCMTGSTFDLDVEVTEWLNDPANLVGNWTFDFDIARLTAGVCAYNPRIVFADEGDAVLFKLRWG